MDRKQLKIMLNSVYGSKIAPASISNLKLWRLYRSKKRKDKINKLYGG